MHMAIPFAAIERYARYVMGVISFLALMVWLTFKASLFSMPSYNGHAWYIVSNRSGYVLASEYKDEAECKRHETAYSVCVSGKSFIDGGQVSTHSGSNKS
jgi:hypothetical protein